MSLLDSVKKGLEGVVSAGSRKQETALVRPDVESLKMNDVYKIDANNWYSAKPYGFKFTSRDNQQYIMFLPISPSNLTITTNFATNVIPTLYGTIEEHSEVRYYDITIEGTTGIAPKFVDPVVSAGGDINTKIKEASAGNGRQSFPVSQGLGGAAGGLFSKTLETINKAAGKALDLLNGGKKTTQKGFRHEDSGYVAFHNLYRFLLRYKADAAGISSTVTRKTHPLTFFNYKDGNQYDVAVRGFALRRSADNPMLYQYSIQLRGYNLRSTSGEISESSTEDRKKQLGLDGVNGSSKLGEIKNFANNAKSILGGALGGIDVLGR